MLYKRLLILACCTMLLACAPRYETRYELLPPTTASGLACLNTCQANVQSCNQSCSSQYAQCSSKAAQQAAVELPERLKAYAAKEAEWKQAMARYETDLRFYEMALRQRELQEELRRTACARDGKDSVSCMEYSRLYHALPLQSPPLRPDRLPDVPTLASETARIRDLTCQQDCGCEAAYRQCYSSCGGTVKPIQVCVENCPSR